MNYLLLSYRITAAVEYLVTVIVGQIYRIAVFICFIYRVAVCVHNSGVITDIHDLSVVILLMVILRLVV